MKQVLATFCLAICAPALVPAQVSDFLDVFEVRAKPEKRADFDAIGRKIAEANRKAKGDNWVAMQTEYGESNTIYFISTRQNYAAIEQGMNAFMGAIKEVYGPAAWKKMEQDWNNTIISSRAQLRMRRWDLSINVPSDREKVNQMVGEARWIRTTQVRVRPGHQTQFEELAKTAKAAYEKANPSWIVLVSQTIAGEPGSNYYLTSMQPSLAGFDSAPNLRKVIGEEAFVNWEKANADTIVSTEARYMRFLPELSNPTDEIASASAEFWRPKPAVPAKPKPKPAEAPKPGQ